jgi:hypothetical protein
LNENKVRSSLTGDKADRGPLNKRPARWAKNESLVPTLKPLIGRARDVDIHSEELDIEMGSENEMEEDRGYLG